MARAHRERTTVLQGSRQSEQCFTAFMDNIPGVAAWMKDSVGRYVYVNKLIAEHLNKDWLGKTDVELWPPEIAARFIAADQEIMAGRAVAQTVEPIDIKGGEERFFLVSKFPMLDPSGKIVLVAGMGIDITEQRRADERIRELGAIVESSSDAILGETLDGIIIGWNKGAEKIYGYTEAEAIGQHISMVVPSGQQDKVPEILGRLARGEEAITHYGTVLRRKDGQEIKVSLTISPIYDLAGQIIGASTIARDVTEQKRVEQKLRESEERFRQLTENIDEVFWIAAADLQSTIYASPAYETIWGRSRESLYNSPKSWIETIHCEDKRRVAETIANHQPETALDMTYRIVRPDGATRWIRDRGFPVRDAVGRVIHIAGAAEDVTEKRELEVQLHQAQKMEAIGQLAAGVAHDFNNLLTVIAGHSELLTMLSPSDSRWKESVSEIRRATELGSASIRQLLAFSCQQILEPKILDLNIVVAEAKQMLQRIIGEDVRLITVLYPRLSAVRADPGQLNQVILNLAVNARDAMPRGGRLTLETSEVDLNAGLTNVPLAIRPGRYVLLTVADTGCGIEPDVQAHIFEPFFSNKSEGQGTGLGLSVVIGIVRQSEGGIEVESKAGRGTKFKIYLPAMLGPAQESAQSTSLRPEGGNETILLVEDEEPVRNITARLLRALGYRVIEAENGDEALRLFNACSEKIDLLLTDVVMPGLGGREVAESLWALDPGLRVLFQSGYTDDTVVRRGILQAEVAFLKKPFTLEVLAIKVREALRLERL